MEKYGNKFQLRSDGNRKTLKFFTNNDSLYLNYDPAKSYVDMHIYDMYTGFVKFLVKIPLHGIDNGNELPSCDEIFNHDHDDPNDGTDDISDREYKDKIFTLSRTTNNISTQDTSTGFGLNIAKMIVEEQGGNLWFESIPGQGATFYFEWKK